MLSACLVLTLGLYQWNGAESNGYEKAKAAEVCAAMREQRGHVEFICYEEGSPRTLDPALSPFAKHLPPEEGVGGGHSAGVRAADAGGDDAQVEGPLLPFEPLLAIVISHARTLEMLGRVEAALRAHERAVRLLRHQLPGSSRLAEALSNLAGAHEQVGELEPAQRLLEEALALLRGPRSYAKEALLPRWGDETIVLSTANTHSYRKVAKTLREYFDDHLRVQDLAVPGDETLYWFGDNDHERWAEHFAAYSPPPLIPRSADVAYSFGVGGPLSGVPLHVHGPGFSETLIGRKRWWLAPPRPKPPFDPNATALEWALSSRSGGGGAPTKGNGDGGVDFAACTVAEGEAIYFPDGWWHATLNLDETVFISSFVNYARDEQGERGADVTGKRPDLDDAFELKR